MALLGYVEKIAKNIVRDLHWPNKK
jgi:hypothetical protein